MNQVLEIISREIKNRNTRFVFPSETASLTWARKINAFTGERSVAVNRFLAWDRFKETAIRTENRDQEPVSDVVRKLFTHLLVKKNAEAARDFNAAAPKTNAFPFSSLIPREFAGQGTIFVKELTKILPSLVLLKSRQEQALNFVPDDEDRDFALLEKEYTSFLAQYGFFEPSWEKPPLRDTASVYYIFFPEAIEDFSEYADLLQREPAVHLVRLSDSEPRPSLYFYDSQRAEIRGAALELRRLHEEAGIPYDDMALSVVELKEVEPYLVRELSLYHIPFRRRAGKPLGDYGTGKLFSLINTCVVNNFSFPALKALLLNEHLPWADPERNEELIEFGIKNNCVSSFFDQGRPVDIWLAAFRRSPREERLRGYYELLKTHLTALSASRSFRDIRNRYFAFRGRVWEQSPGPERIREAYPEAAHPESVFPGFLSRDNCTGEGNAVLARCVEELSALIRLEEEYPGLVPPSPFGFYLDILQEKQYVPLRPDSGVNIFPYRVAAAAPFSCHLVLNVTQNAATVLYEPLDFLRQDKRDKLGLPDTDASPVFFRLYQSGPIGTFKPITRFSASERTFSGWAIPHSYFSGSLETAPPAGEDPYIQERDWWAGNGYVPDLGGESLQFPRRLFSIQKKGFDQWRTPLCGQGAVNFDILRGAFPPEGTYARMLRERIGAVQKKHDSGDYLKVSATDLNKFFYCPVYWLYGKIFAVEGFFPEAKLLDDASLGLLYHEILKNLFARIRKEDRVFTAGHIEKYRDWIRQYTDEAAHHYPAFQGPLAVPLLVSQSAAIAKRLDRLLEIEAEYFSGYTVAELEYSLELAAGDILFNGRLDRVSLSPEGAPVIIDYKTGAPPSKKGSTHTEDSPLEDFQMPMYTSLYEEKNNCAVAGAFFISINQRDMTAVIGSPGGKKGHTREAYQETLDAFNDYVKQFSAVVTSLNFSPGKPELQRCLGCDYQAVCRTTFSLNARERKYGR
ncbi:MAG: PD-(D/E)XK nuclease family protein [Spirochaetaceae bacterium]|jgi:CRISPR/Cas system-associated exonuclease Cas4 (RecB family)|nr:PD-(D/E)XK nuclease family protein [Spirochaetaceae bacterium]